MESRYGIGINNRFGMLIDSDGDGEEGFTLSKKKPVETTKTPAEPVVESKPVKKAEPVDKKEKPAPNSRATKDPKPSNREGKTECQKLLDHGLAFPLI